MTVLNLKPGALYAWKVYQYASAYGGKNNLHVNGQCHGSQAPFALDPRHMGVTMTTKDGRLPPSKTGATRANVDGQLVFVFTRRG